MIIIFSSEKGLYLIEADEFRSFKMVTDTSPAMMPDFQGLRFEDDGVAWIKRDFIRSLLKQPIPVRWDEAFEVMIGEAAQYGWVNAAGEICAHVEFT